MKRVVIRDFGPINSADVLLRDINVIIGEQSIGKSCVLKVSCFCTWVEKRIEIEQNTKRFEKEGGFIEELVNFHRMGGYVHEHTYIGYESDCMKFSYSKEQGFSFEWKEARWEYKRPKVSYVPAERNLVAVIPNWFEVKSVADNIQDFMADWSEARKSIEKDEAILNLNVSYHYDKDNDSDYVRIKDGPSILFSNVSSGLQSLIPLYVHLSNITSEKFRNKETNSVKHQSENQALLDALVEFYGEHFGEFLIKNPKYGAQEDVSKIEKEYIINPDFDKWAYAKFSNITRINHCEIFVEEPEENLFPPTQQILFRTLLNLVNSKQGNTLFISTHSPYILDVLLERENYDYGLFYIQPSEKGSNVKTATEEEVQEMYDAGVDAFFNIERLGDEA